MYINDRKVELGDSFRLDDDTIAIVHEYRPNVVVLRVPGAHRHMGYVEAGKVLGRETFEGNVFHKVVDKEKPDLSYLDTLEGW